MHETANAARTGRIEYRETRDLPRDAVLVLYGACRWSSADKPDQLMAAMSGSHTVISAWDGERLIGLGNAITDGALVVYYPHLLVHPEYQRRGVGREILRRLTDSFDGFHQHSVLADEKAVEFYRSCGFSKPASVRGMWIYSGKDHDPLDRSSSRVEKLFWEVLRWTERPARQSLSIALVILQILAAFLVPIAFLMNDETILVTPFLLAASGYLVAFSTWPMMSGRVFAFALSAPSATIAGGLIVLCMKDAFTILFLALLFVYPGFAAWAGWHGIKRILLSPFDGASTIPHVRQQYSLKTLFFVMTAVAMYVLLGRGLTELAGGDDELIAVAVFVMVNLVFCGLFAWRFIAENRVRTVRSDNP